MNDLLRDTLTERAASTEPPPLDLDGIVAAGNQRITRRRALGVLGGAVATAAVAVGTATVVRPRDPKPQPARPAPFAHRRVTFALGNEIHYGDEIVSVAPHKVTAFVQTDAGFVFLDAENGIHVVDRSGVRSLGKSAWELAADFHGTLVGWVEDFNDRFESVVYDVAARRELVRTAIGNKMPTQLVSLVYRPRIIAIDGGTAYFDTVRGPYRWDIRANRGELLANVGMNAVRAVAAGQIVYQQPFEQPPPAVRLAIAETVSAKTAARFTGQQAYLSPTAAYLATQPNDARPGIQPLWAGLHVVETKSGNPVSLPRSTYFSYYFGQWIDDDTYTVAAEHNAQLGMLDLLVVNARTGTTKVAVPRFTKRGFRTTPPRTASFALPTGRPIIDLGG
jgi:hypothetical protein